MRARSWFRLVVLTAAVAAAWATRPALAADDGAAISGTWDSAVRSNGGIGQVIEMGKDGAMTYRIAAMLEAAYTLDGDRLVTAFTDPKTGKTEKTSSRIRFDGATLIESSDGREIRMTRRQAGAPGAPPIVGLWSYPHETGGTALVMYTADGRMIFRMPIRADRGKWRASPTELMVTLPSPRTFRYRTEGDRLVLTDDRQKELEFRRAELTDYP